MPYDNRPPLNFSYKAERLFDAFAIIPIPLIRWSI